MRLTAACDRPVNDDQWHLLTIKRRAEKVEAFVDNCRPATGLRRNTFTFTQLCTLRTRALSANYNWRS